MASDLAPGSALGRYQILGMLGRGGMANVYKAFQPALERVVALKVIRTALTEDPEFVERFRREARAIARLAHPNIVQVFDFDEIDGRSVLAMQFLDGGTLKEHVTALAASGQRMERSEIARVIRGAADALDYAHRQGVIHRDIKPSNIMLTDGRAVVTDFGIAKILQQATQMTQTGVGVGTPEYMSPEQGMGGAVDARSDVYSLAVVAYELLAGRLPYAADTPMAIVLKHIRDPLPLPSSIDPTLRGPIERVLLKALAKVPADRHASAGELAAALERAVAESDALAVPTVLPRRRVSIGAGGLSLPLPILGAAMALLVGGGAVAAVVATRPATSTVDLPASVAPATAALGGSAAPAATPTRAPVTAPPSETPYAVPKGAPILLAKLDGSAGELTGIANVAGESRTIATNGTLTLQLLKAGARAGTSFAITPRDSYVGELDLAQQTGSNASFVWHLKGSGTQEYLLSMTPRGDIQLAYWNGSANTELGGPVRLSSYASGQFVTLTAIVERARITLLANGYLIAQAPADGFGVSTSPPRVAIGESPNWNGPGVVSISGARFYEVASGATEPNPTATGLIAATTLPTVAAPIVPPPTLAPAAPQTVAPRTVAPQTVAPMPQTPPPANALRITGRVTAAAGGAGVVSVRVEVRANDSQGTTIGTTTTDQSGAYAVSVPPGTYRVNFVPPVTAPYAPQFWNAQASISAAALLDLSSAPADGVNASLLAAYLVSGAVSHQSDGSAAGSANVHIRDSGRSHVAWATADGSGRYSTRLASGTYILEFLPPGVFDATPLTTKNITVGASDLPGVNGLIP